MDPLTLAMILGGTQLASGAMQYFTAQDARDYEQQQLDKLQDALNRIGIPEARPEYFTPEVYEYLENYDPEVAAFVREQDPRMLQIRSAEGVRAKKAEESVLQDILGRAREGTDVLAEIQRARGMREAAGTMASQSATLQQQLQRQGQQGGLAAYGAALQQQQGAGQQAALAGEQAALAGLQERGRALGEAGALAGRQIGRELDIESANVAAINAFNRRMAERQQEQANLGAQIRNQAQLENIRGRQRISEKNIAAAADAKQRQMDFEQQKYQNQLAKYGKGSQQVQAGISARQASAQDINRMIQGIGDVAGTATLVSQGYTPQGWQRPQQQQASNLNVPTETVSGFEDDYGSPYSSSGDVGYERPGRVGQRRRFY